MNNKVFKTSLVAIIALCIQLCAAGVYSKPVPKIDYRMYEKGAHGPYRNSCERNGENLAGAAAHPLRMKIQHKMNTPKTASLPFIGSMTSLCSQIYSLV